MWDFIGWSRWRLGVASAAVQYVVTHPRSSHNPINLDFLLDPLSKSEFLSLMGETDYEVNLDAWRLKVTGHVKTPLSLTYSQMLSLPSIERSVLLICPGFLANKVFLAYDVNAKALSKKHGFPLRVVAEGYYGTNWVKYVYKVKV